MVAEPVNLVGVQSDINEEDNSVGSVEIQPSILRPNSMEGTSVNISAGKVGCYNCHLPIDSSWPLCMFELRGKCNNDECPWQHVKDYSCGNMNVENSDPDCQVGSSNQRGKSYGETSTLKANHCLGLAPPTYLVCLDMLKADLHPNVLDSTGKSVSLLLWFFPVCFLQICLLTNHSCMGLKLVLRSMGIGTHIMYECNRLPVFLTSFTHMVFNWSQLDQHFADDDQSLEMVLLNLHQEVNKRKGRIEELKVLSQALEANLSSVVLWVVYLHIFYSNEKSIGKDDLFLYAVENVDGSYELWLMYANSRIQLEDRLVAYDTALLALCRHASASDSDTVHASACILDLFLQLVNCLCNSGNSDKAIEKIGGLFPSTKNSDQPHHLLLSSILQCLTLHDKYIFWLCCVYFTVYRKLPDATVKQFECEKEISVLEWPSACLTIDEKQQAVHW